MKRIWWKLSLGILLVFSAGTAFGVFGTVIVAQGFKQRMEDPKIAHATMVKHLDGKLKLTDAQHEEISRIMEEMIGEVVPVRDESRHQLAQIVNHHGPRIREVLNPAQREKFDRFLAKLARDWNIVLVGETKSSS